MDLIIYSLFSTIKSSEYNNFYLICLDQLRENLLKWNLEMKQPGKEF